MSMCRSAYRGGGEECWDDKARACSFAAKIHCHSKPRLHTYMCMREREREVDKSGGCYLDHEAEDLPLQLFVELLPEPRNELQLQDP